MDHIQNEPATTTITTTTPLAIEEQEPNKLLSPKSQYSYHNLPHLIPRTLLFFLLLLPLLYYTYVNSDTDRTLTNHHLSSTRSVVDHRRRRYRGCDDVVDFSSGEWVPNPDGPRYTNESCGVIHKHQNCMRNGRPDLGYTMWKWKPSGGGGSRCDPAAGFDPLEFLETVRGKSMAFVGDSIVRNQVQSLICLLSKVEYPLDVSTSNNNDSFNFPRWIYKTHNFTLSSFWSPYLVRFTQDKPRHSNDYGRINLHLDDPDPSWSTAIDDFDFLILGAGHWFTRPLNYHTAHNTPLGCTYYCEDTDPRNLTVVYPTSYGYRRAFRTAFSAILARQRFKGTVFLRTFAPAHFEGGEWDAGGDCKRVRPWRSDDEVELEGQDKEFYVSQVEEFNLAREEGGRRGRGGRVEFVLVDVTKAMLLRPDGHPSKYGRDREDNATVTTSGMTNDCVHWCLPGPVDYWNYLLLEMLRR